MTATTHKIIVFDAKCLLCNGWVQFLLKHDKNAVFQFASIQGNTGQKLLIEASIDIANPDTLLLIDGKDVYSHSGAILRIVATLSGPWRIIALVGLIPAPLRDRLYSWVARNRYRWFGRLDTCAIPPVDYKARFLD